MGLLAQAALGLSILDRFPHVLQTISMRLHVAIAPVFVLFFLSQPAWPQAKAYMWDANLGTFVIDGQITPELQKLSADVKAPKPKPINTDPTDKSEIKYAGDGILSLNFKHRKETLDVVYKDEQGNYIPEALKKIDHLLRCPLTGKQVSTPVRLIELLDYIQDNFGSAVVEVYSGYRSPKLNNAMADVNDGVAKNSLHMKGWALDLSIPGVKLKKLKDFAVSLKAGGVGYYPNDNFIHIDIGRARQW